MKKYTAWVLALLFYVSVLPWNMAGAAFFNYNAHNITGDNTGRIQDFSIGSASYTDNGYFNDLITKGPWVDVRAHIPVALHAGIAAGTDNSDLSTYMQSAVDNASKGTVLFPKGHYHGSFTITNDTNIVGVGPQATRLTSDHSTNPAIKINNYASQTYYGTVYIGHIGVSSSSQDGIHIDGQGHALLHDVLSLSNGRYGVYLGPTVHTTYVTLRSCVVQSNGSSGIYGRTLSAKQINVVNLLGNKVTDNGGSGIDLTANSLNIIGGSTEGNTYYGIKLSALDVGSVEASAQSILITGVHWEGPSTNVYGFIRVETDYTAPYTKSINHLRVFGNYATITTANAHASATAIVSFDTNASSLNRHSIIGINDFTTDNVSRIAWYDFGASNALDEYSTVYINAQLHYDAADSPFTSLFLNRGNAKFVPLSYITGTVPPSGSPFTRNLEYLDTTTFTMYKSLGIDGAVRWRPITSRSSGPSTPTDACTHGETAYGSGYYYWCYGTDTWRRVAYDNTW